MARKSAKKRPDKLTDVTARHELRRLWKKISAAEWLALLHEIAPDNKWTMQGHNTIKGCCPYHVEQEPSFSISLSRSMGKCFGGTCSKAVYNPVQLVAKLRNCSFMEAALFLGNRYGFSDMLGGRAQGLDAYNDTQELKKAVAIAMNQVLIEVLRDDPDRLSYCRPALIYLRDVRKIPLEVLHTLPVGVYAKPEHLKKYIPDQRLHDSVDTYFAKYQSTAFWGALAFHYNDSPGTITRFKLRLLNTNILPPAPTLGNLSSMDLSTKKQFVLREFAYVEDPYNTGNMGVYGLHKYHRLIGANDTNAYITEGEFDVLSVIAAQETHENAEFMIFGTGGKGSPDIGFLREYGINTCWLVPDHPAKNGDQWALSILANKHNFEASISMKPLALKVFQWQVDLQGMDLDEAVILNGYPAIVDFLFRKRNAFFRNSTPWLMTLCDKELRKIDQYYDSELDLQEDGEAVCEIQQTNLADEKQRAKRDSLLHWFRYIHDPSDRLMFSQRYAMSEGIDISQLPEINTLINSLGTMDGVSNLVLKHLLKFFSVGYYELSRGGITIYLWSNEREETVELKFEERSLQMLISMYVSSNVIQWFDSILGDNPVYTANLKGDDPLRDAKTKIGTVNFILNYAFSSIIHQARNKNDLIEFAQGIHFDDLPETTRRKNQLYFVNGKKVFRGTFGDPGEVEWERIHSMVDDNVLFTNLSASSKWSFVEDESDLYAATQVDLRKTYDMIYDIVDAWYFQNDEIIKPYIVAYIMSLPIMRAVGNVSITMLTGDKESGKTSFVEHLLGGTRVVSDTRVLPILESALPMSDATSPAMYQYFSGSSLTFVLDEAEQSKDHNSRHDQRNKELIRHLYSIPMGAVYFYRGGATKDAKTCYQVRMPVLMAAINIPADSTFLSRTLVLYTVKDNSREDSMDYINTRYTPEQIEDLRRKITIGLLPHIPNIIERKRTLRKRLQDVGRRYAMVSNRFLNTVLTPLTIYEKLGFNAEELYEKIVNCYKDRLESINAQDHQHELINTCLYTEGIKVAADHTLTDNVSAKYLILRGELNTLNNSECGVYYLTRHNWIIIVWRQVKYALLQRTSYAGVEESALREQASKNVYVVSDISKEDQHDIQYHLRLADVRNASDYTVLRADYLIKQDVAARPPKDQGAEDNSGDLLAQPPSNQRFVI